MKRIGIIAFCGSKGSGKSTSAMVFKDLIGVPTEEIAIAGHLKEACARVFNIDYNKFIDPALKEVELEECIVLDRKNLEALMKEFFVQDYTYDTHIRQHIARVLRTPRALLQYIGTEVLHPIDPLIHVRVAMKKKDPSKLTIITDLRFVAEFEYFTAQENFVPVYVKNTQAEIRASVDGHASERQFENFRTKCRYLNNEGSLTELSWSLGSFIEGVYE